MNIQQIGLPQFAQGTDDVNRGQPQGVDDMLLGQGQVDGIRGAVPGLAPHPVEQLEQQMGDPLAGRSPPHIGQVLVGQGAVTGGDPGHPQGELGMGPEQIEQVFAGKHADRDIGQAIGRMGRRRVEIGLETEECAGQGEIEDLPSAILQHLIEAHPAVEQGIEIVADLVLAVEIGARGKHAVSRFEMFHDGDLAVRQRRAKRIVPHRTSPAVGGNIENFSRTLGHHAEKSRCGINLGQTNPGR